MTEARKQCLKALAALYLVVEEDIADDIKHKVLEALHEAETLTEAQVEQIFKDGVYSYPEYHKWEEERGAVTKLAAAYMAKRKPARAFPLGSQHMSNLPFFQSAFKPFKDNGCEFIYGSPPRDEQCTKPPAYEIKSTAIKGRSTDGRYLVCEKHRDELYNYVKGLDPDATIEKLPPI